MTTFEPIKDLPAYIPGTTSREAWAHFASGATVRAVRGRLRRYPGLGSEAPPTQAFYDAVAQLASDHSHILDVGCGSGEGARRLAAVFERVTALDADSEALAFARELAPLVSFAQHDLAQVPDVPAASAAIVADVLSQVRDPTGLLRSTRGALTPGATVVVAEQSAFTSQTLSVPVRRAFSKRSLTSLLTVGGFKASGWICDAGSFLACVAEPRVGAAAEALMEGERLRARGDGVRALTAYRVAAKSRSIEVQREVAVGEALTAFALGDGDRAARAWFRLRELDAGDARAFAGLSQLALAAEDIPQAMRLAVEAEDLEPTEPTAAQALGLCADAAGMTEAFSTWRIAARLAPDDPAVATKLARAAAERGDYGLCISVFDRLRQYGDPLGPAFHVTLAWLLIAQGRQADAALEAQLAIALAPNDPAVLELWRSISSQGDGAAPLGGRFGMTSLVK